LSYGFPTHSERGDCDKTSRDIQLELQLSGYELTACVRDNGRAFNPLNAPHPDIDQALALRQEGGLGIHFVRELTDACEYRRDGGHNQLTLVLRHAPEKPLTKTEANQ